MAAEVSECLNRSSDSERGQPARESHLKCVTSTVVFVRRGDFISDAGRVRSTNGGPKMSNALPDSDVLRPETWHTTVKALYDYWISIHPAAGLPGRQHVDPTAIPRLLAHVFMVDVSRDPLRFKYRLMGTEYTMLIGRDLTGRYLDEVHPGFHGLILRQYTEAAELGRPAFRKGPIMYARSDKQYPDKQYLGMERLIVPLARNGVDVEMILGVVVYTPAK
jgi:hypothetical protein